MSRSEFVYAETEPPSLRDLVDSRPFRRLVQSSARTLRGELVTDDTALFIPATCAGLKPGFTASFHDIPPQTLSEYLTDIGLSHKWSFESSLSYTVVHASPSTELVEDMTFSVEDEAYGRLLGVPQEDLCWYGDDKEQIDAVTPIPLYLDLNPDDWLDLPYARLASWICRPTEEGLRRTIDIGKQWYSLAEELEHEHGFLEARKYANRQMDRAAHSWYSFVE